ncbi:hypothetical protein Dimus_002702 [Dionaea muscipula]
MKPCDVWSPSPLRKILAPSRLASLHLLFFFIPRRLLFTYSHPVTGAPSACEYPVGRRNSRRGQYSGALAYFSCQQMAEEIASNANVTADAATKTTSSWRWPWPSVLRWIPTSTDHIIAAEKRLLSIVRTPYVQEQVNIGSGPPGSKVRWFRSASNEPRFINTVTFASSADSPTLVMVHGYGASQGFFFRNFDTLASRFRVIAIDQLGCGGSSRPDFTCKSTEETEAWFIDSFEEWRKAKNLSDFILLGHSFGGYVAAKYALKHPEHVKHLILVGPAGFSAETDISERLNQFRATWKGAILNHLWESNLTPQKIIRGLGPWGPDLVRRYTTARFGSYSTGDALNEEESRLLTGSS